MNLLDRLFYDATARDLYYVQRDRSLDALYQQIPEAANIGKRMEEALENAGLTTEAERAESMKVYWDNCDIVEKQGFINGLRYGAALAKELFADC